jgi:hypothetical protein
LPSANNPRKEYDKTDSLIGVRPAVLVTDCAEADPPPNAETAAAAVAVNDPRKKSRRLLNVIRISSPVTPVRIEDFANPGGIVKRSLAMVLPSYTPEPSPRPSALTMPPIT